MFLSTRKGISFDEYGKEIARLIKQSRPPGAKGEYPETVYAAFAKSLETLQGRRDRTRPASPLRLPLPDGVDLWLLMVEWGHEYLPATLATAMADKFARGNLLASLASLSLLRQEDGPAGPMLIFHRLLLEVVRDWMGDDARAPWASAAVQLVNGAFPDHPSEPSKWLKCARLMPHIVPLEAHAPRTGEVGRALDRLLNQAQSSRQMYVRARRSNLA